MRASEKALARKLINKIAANREKVVFRDKFNRFNLLVEELLPQESSSSRASIFYTLPSRIRLKMKIAPRFGSSLLVNLVVETAISIPFFIFVAILGRSIAYLIIVISSLVASGGYEGVQFMALAEQEFSKLTYNFIYYAPLLGVFVAMQAEWVKRKYRLPKWKDFN